MDKNNFLLFSAHNCDARKLCVILLFALLFAPTSPHAADSSQDGAISFPDSTNYNDRVNRLRGQYHAVNDRLDDNTKPIAVPLQTYRPQGQGRNPPDDAQKRTVLYDKQQANSRHQGAQARGKFQQLQNSPNIYPQNNQPPLNFQNYRPEQYADPSLNQPIRLESIDKRQPVFSSNMGHGSLPLVQSQEYVNHIPLKAQEQTEGSTNSNADAVPVEPATPASASVTGFGLDLMKVLDNGKPVNTVVSPYSIALILALLQQGTEGEAQTQISGALRMNPLQSRENFRQHVSAVKSRRSRNILKIATSIFYSNTYDVNQQYKNDAVQFFSSDLTAVNFNNNIFTSKLINDWISTGTKGYIPHLVGPDTFPPETLMVLANAVFFKGLWNSTFNPERTINRPFFMGGGAFKETSFMHHTGPFRAGKDAMLGADFLVMPFEGLQYSLISVLPSVKSNVSSLIRQLSHEHLARYLASPVREAIISIPKFDIRVDTNLLEPLKALGIRTIFTANSGLSALGDARGGRPRVSASVHTAILSIDEQGGSAAAATLLAVSTLSIDFNDLEFRFNADRPFVCVLWDNELNVPLFIAKIADPVVAKRN